LAKDPSARPSFEEIFDEFAACHFEILPDVDSNAIAEYVGEVLDGEKRGAARKD
jgi:hypothetical protein